MTNPIPDPGRRGLTQALLWPGGLSVVLVLALWLVPFPAASAWVEGGYASQAALVDALSSAFVRFWGSGSGEVGPDLAAPLDFWMWFHLIKAALAAALLLVLAHLGSRVWAAYTQAATAASRMVVGALALTTGMAATIALVVLVANVQGSIAPMTSAWGLLPVGSPTLDPTFAEVRQALAAETSNPALEVLVRDFTRYHQAMAALGGLTAVGLLAAAVAFWRRRSRQVAPPRRGRHLLAAASLAGVLLSGFFAVVAAANVSTSARPIPALMTFFAGGL